VREHFFFFPISTLIVPSIACSGTDTYDSSEKRRIPAWCDRILWRTDQHDKVRPLHYTRGEVNVSDHKPVLAGFEVEVKAIVPELRARVWEETERAWQEVEKDVVQVALAFARGE
jgi:hypothetical protein